jgi:hypothetical protein
MLGDPSVRVVDVYVPAWHDGQGLPLLMDLVDFAGSGLSHTTQFLGIRLPVTFDTCEVIEERWANWLRQDPVVAIEIQADNLRRLKAPYITVARRISSTCSTALTGSCDG